MAKTDRTLRFIWTEQCQRMAMLLSAMGHSDVQIAQYLKCDGSTIGDHLGRKRDRPRLSADEMRDLFEQFDAQRNMQELIIAASGSPQQARLRTSLRIQNSKSKGQQPGATGKPNEDLSDEQLRREVEALVGKTIRIPGGS